MNEFWSWALTLIGVSGFWLAGRKVWWAWYINIGNQIIWTAYALTTQQWGFLLGVPIYLAVFVPNAVRWTREHRENARLAAEYDRVRGYDRPRELRAQEIREASKDVPTIVWPPREER